MSAAEHASGDGQHRGGVWRQLDHGAAHARGRAGSLRGPGALGQNLGDFFEFARDTVTAGLVCLQFLFGSGEGVLGIFGVGLVGDVAGRDGSLQFFAQGGQFASQIVGGRVPRIGDVLYAADHAAGRDLVGGDAAALQLLGERNKALRLCGITALHLHALDDVVGIDAAGADAALLGRLVDTYTHIFVEDLNVNGLARSHVAKSMSDAGWRQFLDFLNYKAESAGGSRPEVDARKSSQTCPLCNRVAPKSLSVRIHECECGYVVPRDAASAQVVELRGLEKLEDGSRRTDERRIPLAGIPGGESESSYGVRPFRQTP